MIRTEAEYRRTLEQLEQDRSFIRQQREQFRQAGLDGEQLDRALHPSLSFHEQRKEEIKTYEEAKRGEFSTLRSLEGVGRWLISARIAKGWSQKQLAEALGVSEAQVSRDERNEYHGIKIDRAQRILEVMDFHFRMEGDDVLNSLSEPINILEEGERASPPVQDMPEQVAAFLRGDPRLSAKKATSLARLFRVAYEAVASSDEGGA
jgi:transcriptional regulator with XRE-family HTH domain